MTRMTRMARMTRMTRMARMTRMTQPIQFGPDRHCFQETATSGPPGRHLSIGTVHGHRRCR